MVIVPGTIGILARISLQWSLPKLTLREEDNPLQRTNLVARIEFSKHVITIYAVSKKRTILYNRQKPCPQRVRYSETLLYIQYAYRYIQLSLDRRQYHQGFLQPRKRKTIAKIMVFLWWEHKPAAKNVKRNDKYKISNISFLLLKNK